MSKVKDFLAVAVPPSALNSEWLQRAKDAVSVLIENGRSHEVVLYSNVGQSYVHSVLVPLTNVMPSDGESLEHAHIDASSHWALEHARGGGEPDRMYLADPLNHTDCKSLLGGEQLVFRRSFVGVDKGHVRTEMSQRLVQALDLYFMEEKSAYCCLNEDGDIEPIIRLHDLSQTVHEANAILVTIAAEHLHRYMAVTESALVMKFDFTRNRPGSFGSWDRAERGSYSDNDLFFHFGVQPDASFANGVVIVRPALTKDMIIAKRRSEWDSASKQYAVFKAYDWKNKRLAEISCGPGALASYFDKDSSLPFQTTPAFFKPDVLLKYKADTEKYRLEHRSIYARGGWHLKSYDVNEEGQVHAYLYDLAKLPYSEQLYWQSFNEWPKSGISKRAIETDFEGTFSTIADPLVDLKNEVIKLDKASLDWWRPRGDGAAFALHYPLTASSEEWSNAILALDQFIVEGFILKALRARLDESATKVDPSWASIRVLQALIVATGLTEEEASEIVEPLKLTHFLRTKVKGHLAETEKQAIIKKAITEYGSLAAHFRALVEGVQVGFSRIVEILTKGEE